MSSVSTSPNYNVSNSSSGGLTGLVSGMDTSAMVDAMLMGQQSKIDSVNASITQGEWKQEIYRDLITQLNTFKSSFFDSSIFSSSKTSLTNQSLFNSLISSVTSGSGVNVLSTSSSANKGDMSVKVNQLASSSSLKSQSDLGVTHSIDGDRITSFTEFQKMVVFNVGDSTVRVDLNSCTTNDEIAETMTKAFSEAGHDDISAKIYDGKLRVINESGKTVSVSALSSSLGLETAGLKEATTSSFTTADGKNATMIQGSTAVDAKKGPSIDVTLDGVTKTISLANVKTNSTGRVDIDTLAESINAEVQRVFGSYVKVEKNEDSGLSFKLDYPDNSSHELRITGVDANLLKITPGSTTSFSTSQTLGDLGSGDLFEFSINNVDFSFTSDTTVASMMSQINSSNAGVTMKYSTLTSSMEITSKETGAQQLIDIKQSKGDIMTKLFGEDEDGNALVGAAGSVATGQITTNNISGNSSTGDFFSGQLTLEVNGTKHTLTIDAKDNDTAYSASEVQAHMSNFVKTLSDNFGYDISYQSSTGLTISDPTMVVSVVASDVDMEDNQAVNEAKKNDAALYLGLSGKNNLATGNTSVSDLADTDLAAALTAQGVTKLGDLQNNTSMITGASVSFEDGRLVVSDASTSADYNKDLSALTDAINAFGGFPLDTKITGDAVSSGDFAGGTINMTIDGTAFSLELDASDNVHDKMKEALSQLGYGDLYHYDSESNTVTLGNNSGVSISVDNSAVAQHLGIAEKANITTIDEIPDDALKNALMDLGYSGTDALTSINVTGNAGGKDLTIGLQNGEFVMQEAGSSVNLEGTALESYFSDKTISFGSGVTNTDAVTAGKDAEVVINGVTTTRSSNSFTIDGVTMQITAVTKDGEEGATINTVSDYDAIVDAVSSFIEGYNAIVEKISGLVTEKANYRDYPPLTEAQEKEMTDKEIELWNEKAKQGLLRGDSTLNSMLSSMRSLLYTKPDSSSLGLYQIGIETSSKEGDPGTLVFDEEAFRTALANYGSEVTNLFTDKEGGIATRMESVLKSYANTSSGSPGLLVTAAGVEGTATSAKNDMSSHLAGLKERLQALERTYELQKNRYWSQFSAMETMMTQISSQSAYLMSAFGGY